jgi:NADP-dependent 3-hydroxy acid dehydrogenase YdfG
MALDLSGTPVFITGAGSGIGRATALKFASARADLFLVGRTETKLLETQNQIKELYPDVKVAISAIDVTNKKALEGAVTQAVEHFGGLAVVVSNGT